MRKLLILIALCGGLVAHATTYRVTTTGSDSNPCTTASPCLTITHGLTKAVLPDDVLQVLAGTYNESPSLINAGTLGHPIVIQGFSTACPTVPVSDVNNPLPNRYAPTVIVNGNFSVQASFLTINCFANIAFGGAGGYDFGSGVQHVVVQNFVIDGTSTTGPGGGIFFPGVGGTPSASYDHDITISTGYNLGTSNFIFGPCSACTYINNESFALQGDEPTSDGSPPPGGSGSDHDHMDVWGIGTSIVHNYLHGNTANACYSYDCHMDCIQTFNTTGDGTEVSKNITVDRNICFNSHEGIIVQDNGGNGDVSNWTITNTVDAYGPYDDGSGHLPPAGTAHPWCWIFEDGALGTNVFENFTCLDGTMGFRNNSGSATFLDDIYYSFGSQTTVYDTTGATVTCNHNLYFATSGTFGSAPCTSSIINSNPNFVSIGTGSGTEQCTGCNYNILTSSPAKNAGATSVTSVDLLGVARPQGSAYDIGAYEFPIGTLTTLTLGNTVAVANVMRPGLNLGGNLAYSQGQMLQNLNQVPGFGDIPGIYWQTSAECSPAGPTQTTTAWYNDVQNAGGYPTNFWVGATYEAYHNDGTILGTGTITASTANTGGTGTTFTLGTALSAPCTTGTNTAAADLIVIHRRANVPGSVTAAEKYSGSGLSYSSDLNPSSTNNIQSLAIADGGNVNWFFDQSVNWTLGSSPGNITFINVNGSYTFSYWAKCTGSAGSVGVVLGRVGGTSFVNTTDTITSCSATTGLGWQQFTHSFTGTETGSQTTSISLQLNATSPTGSVIFSDIDPVEGTALIGNTTAFRDALVKKLIAMKPGSLRLMTPPSWCSDPQDQFAPAGQRRICGLSNFIRTAASNSIGYTEFLQLCDKVGAAPYITLGNFITPADMTYMVNKLSTDGWTALFAGKGQHIYLATANEPWNPGAAGQLDSGNGSVYGAILGPIVTAGRAASGYTPTIKFVGGAWSSRSQAYGTGGGWTNNVLVAAGCTTGAQTSCPDYMEGAPYTLGELDDLTDPFTDLVANGANWDSVVCPPSTCNQNSMYAFQDFLASKGMNASVYEANVGIQSGTATPTRTQMNSISQGVGTAITVGEHHLLMARDAGIIGPRNEFANLDQPSNGAINGTSQTAWTAQAYLAAGPGQIGTWIDIGRPEATVFQLINNCIANNTNIITSSASGTPTFNYPGGQNNTIPANSAVNIVETFFYGDGAGHYCLIAVNNSENTIEPISLTGTGAPAGSVQKIKFGGSVNAIGDNNIDSTSKTNPMAVVGIPTASTLGSLTTDNLDPASMTLYTWSNVAGPSAPVNLTGTVRITGSVKVQLLH